MLKLKMMRATYLTKLANIPKLIDGGHIERACLLTDVINNTINTVNVRAYAASLVKLHPRFRSAEFGKKL